MSDLHTTREVLGRPVSMAPGAVCKLTGEKLSVARAAEVIEDLEADSASCGTDVVRGDHIQSSTSSHFSGDRKYFIKAILPGRSDPEIGSGNNLSITSASQTLDSNLSPVSQSRIESPEVGSTSCFSSAAAVFPSVSSGSNESRSDSHSPTSCDQQKPWTEDVVSKKKIKQWMSFDSLKLEDIRLLTFIDWPLDFIHPEDLARAGFFYLKHSDRVQCAFCRGMVGEWEVGDEPFVEHRRHFPRCPFVCGLPVGNVPHGQTGVIEEEEQLGQNYDTCRRSIDEVRPYSFPEKRQSVFHHGNFSNGTSVCSSALNSFGVNAYSGPCKEHYRTLQQRLSSFEDWPAALEQKPRQLAEAGFYYVGLSDHVKCFHCDGGLRNWERGDDPWTEHARWFPKCPFVLLVKGEEFVKLAVAVKPLILSAPLPVETESEGDPHSEVHKGYCTPTDVATIIEQATEMGFQRSMVERVLVERFDSQVTGIMEVIDGLLDESVQEKIEHSSQTKLTDSCVPFDKNEQYSVSTGAEVRTGSEHEGKFSVKKTEDMELTHPESSGINGQISSRQPAGSLTAATSGTAPENSTLLQENERLKLVQTCKVCMDEEIGVVFLPCGHFAACINCAPALSLCPLCRTGIQGTIRTFLS